MKNLVPILDAWARTARGGKPAVLATVVEVEGSAYRRPGARMLLPDAGSPTGLVSGGCLEADLIERAREVLSSGAPRSLLYDMRSPDERIWGLGLGCNGAIRVMLERLDPDAPPGWLRVASDLRSTRRPVMLATVFETRGNADAELGGRLVIAADGTIAELAGLGRLEPEIVQATRAALAARVTRVARFEVATALIERLLPIPWLHVFGAGGDAEPLVRQACALGWRVSIRDHREAYADARRFPPEVEVMQADYAALVAEPPVLDERSPVVVMTHHFRHDATLLRWLAATPAPYVGVLGPRRRAENLVREIAGESGRAAALLQRLRGPVGLDIGSETPDEIALSVIAEIQAVLAGRDGGFLRDRAGPLHAWPDPAS